MDLTTESLEALIYKATDVRNKGIDNQAVEAFCGIVKKNPDYAFIASKLVATRIQSVDEWEALQGLSVLESCMRKCGPSFHSEVGKFRFLNELIKLVSPKYLGPRTSPKVRDIAIRLLHSWTVAHSNEPKIKEAYEMLKKQGVVTDEVPKTPEIKPTTVTPAKSNLPVDHEFESKLKKLLNSKNPDDLEAANRMIKSKVLETERRTTELERVRTNVRLLSDMIGNCQPGAIPVEDRQLMDELHSECERLRPFVYRMAAETHDSDALNDILILSEEFAQAFEKYGQVVVLGGVMSTTAPGLGPGPGLDLGPGPALTSSPSSLLDFTSPVENKALVPETTINPDLDLLGGSISVLDLSSSPSSLNGLSSLPPPSHPMAVVPPPSHPKSGSDLDQLGAIFGALNTSAPSGQNASSGLNLSSGLNPSAAPRPAPAPAEKSNKQKALDELDVLGESLMQQCKDDIQHSKELALETFAHETADDEIMDLAGPKSLDEVMLGSDELSLADPSHASTNDKVANAKIEPIAEPIGLVKPLTDVSVTLEKITPSDIPPLRILDSSNGVGIMAHLARDCPRDDVSVYVVTTTSTSHQPLTDYLFQVVVPKGCKFKLQVPSATSLPAHNPFLPAAAITQILLIANPNGMPLRLTFMLSFTRDDETITEVGEIPELPTLRK